MGPRGPQFKSGRPDSENMKKKAFFSISGIILVVNSLLFAARVEIPSITVANPQSQPFVDVNVYFSCEKNFSGYQIAIQYNQQVLKLLEASKGPAVSSFTTLTNTSTPGIIRIAGFNPTLSGISGNGILAVLRFQVINPGYSNLILSSVKLSEASGQSMPCSVSSGSVRAGETAQPEKASEKPQSEETKSKEKPKTVQPSIIVPKSEQKPLPSTIQEQAPVNIEDMDIDELLLALEMQKSQEPKEKPQQKPSNSVTLLVLSEYGNPIPSTGITTFTKGDRVDCRVESEILISDMEKAVCLGCEGKGSAYNTKSNSISFVIEKDSKIEWRWKKVPVPPGLLIEVQKEVKLPQEGKTTIPIKLRFIGGFDERVILQAESKNFDCIFSETILTREKNETQLYLNKKTELYCGTYEIEIVAISKESNLKTSKKIEISLYGYAMLGDITMDETSKTVKIPLEIKGIFNDISSFEMILAMEENLKFIRIETEKNIKPFTGYSQKGRILKVSGGIVPSVAIKDNKIFNFVFLCSKDFDKKMIKLLGFKLWNSKGEPLPISVR